MSDDKAKQIAEWARKATNLFDGERENDHELQGVSKGEFVTTKDSYYYLVAQMQSIMGDVSADNKIDRVPSFGDLRTKPISENDVRTHYTASQLQTIQGLVNDLANAKTHGDIVSTAQEGSDALYKASNTPEVDNGAGQKERF